MGSGYLLLFSQSRPGASLACNRLSAQEPAWLIWEFVGGCGATPPPAGRLLQGPELITGEASLPLPGGPDFPIYPSGLAPEMCLGLPGSAERGGWIFRFLVFVCCFKFYHTPFYKAINVSSC